MEQLTATPTAENTVTAPAAPLKIFPIGSVQTVESYPYGRLRCKAFFSIEFKKKQGFRTVFQTINPKNDRLNAQKYSTYTDFAFNYLCPETGHIKNGYKAWNGSKYYNSFA